MSAKPILFFWLEIQPQKYQAPWDFNVKHYIYLLGFHKEHKFTPGNREKVFAVIQEEASV